MGITGLGNIVMGIVEAPELLLTCTDVHTSKDSVWLSH